MTEPIQPGPEAPAEEAPAPEAPAEAAPEAPAEEAPAEPDPGLFIPDNQPDWLVTNLRKIEQALKDLGARFG